MSNITGLIGIGLIIWASITIFSILGYISENFISLSIGSIIPVDVSNSANLLLGLVIFALGAGLIYKAYGK